MSKYTDWMKKQSESFRSEILKDSTKVGRSFLDERHRAISLDELKQLDAIFNLPAVPEEPEATK